MNTGDRFGRLVVVSRADASGGHRRWLCRCDCGNSSTYREAHLLSGATRSCRCLSRETTGKRVRTHGLGETPEYGVWKAMKRRCYNANTKDYPGYGGRGITVCDRWRNDFAAFLFDMGIRPPGASIDRIDNNGPYSPDNCRWTDSMTQAHNSSKVKRLTFRGEALPMSEWARRSGLQVSTLYARLRNGWTIERALTTPTQ